ncbi:MAG: hypothetical protein JWQ74_392 [Marmoricola sp.]|nr:hypothetical protein [Marmoricola sp.]
MRRLLGVAVAFLLVAGGIALGTGPLQGDTAAHDRELAAAKAEVAERDGRIAGLAVTAGTGSRFAGATASAVLSGVLTGHAVAVVALPGADPAAVAAMRTLVVTAGGRVTADVGLADALVSADGRPLLDALTSQMLTPFSKGTGRIAVPASANGYGRFGALLARALGVPSAAKKRQASYDATSVAVIAGLRTAKLIDPAKVTARAALTLVVTGPSAATSAPLLQVVRAYGSSAPTVVVGPTSSAEASELIGKIRSGGSGPTSTLDGTETTIGRVDAVLALAARSRGIVGAYGTAGTTSSLVPPLD